MCRAQEGTNVGHGDFCTVFSLFWLSFFGALFFIPMSVYGTQCHCIWPLNEYPDIRGSTLSLADMSGVIRGFQVGMSTPENESKIANAGRLSALTLRVWLI